MDATTLTSPSPAALLDAALSRVESHSIRQWASTPHNLPLWLDIATHAVARGRTDADRLAAYIVAVAIGL